MLAIIQRIFKQMLNDKRALAMILLAPLLIMSFMYFILGDSFYVPKVSLVDVPIHIEEVLQAEDLQIIHSDVPMDTQLRDESVDAVLYFEDGGIQLRMLEPNNIILQKITVALQGASGNKQNSEHVSFIYGTVDASTFDSMVHVLLGVYAFFLVFLISGIAFVRERTVGTMERFMLTPISKFSVVGGFIIGYGIFAVIQSILLILFVTFALGITITGSAVAMVLVMTVLSFVAIATGALISGLAKNEFQVIQFIPLILTPQIFFSGLIPIATLPYGLDKVAQVMPIYHAVSALNKVLYQYATVATILPHIGMLTAFLGILFMGNIIILGKYRAV